jgi:GAF domain-containing protein/HAMP domain-containing protein
MSDRQQRSDLGVNMMDDRNRQQMESPQQQTATRITLITFVLMVIVTVVTVFFVPSGEKTPIDNYMMPFIALCAGYSYYLARKGSYIRGVYVLLGGIAIASVLYPLAANNVGWQVAIVMLLITTSIANNTLPEKTAGRISVAAFLLAIIVILEEQFVSGIVDIPLTTSAVVITGVLAVIYFGLTLYRFRQFALRTKLILAFVLTAIVSLSTLAFIVNRTNNQQLIQNFGERITAETEARALIVGDTLAKELQGLQALSLNKSLQDYVDLANFTRYDGKSSTTIQSEILALDETWQAADIANTDDLPLIDDVINNETAVELRKYREIFPENAEVFVTDSHGANIAATNRTSDYYQADEPWWQAAYNDGQGAVFIGEPTFDTSSNLYAIAIALPVYSHDATKIVGVLRTTLDMETILSILNAAKLGETGRIKLYLADGRRVPVEEGERTFGDMNALRLPLDAPGFIDSSYDDIPSLVSRAPVTSTDERVALLIDQLRWSLVSNLDRSEVLAQAQEQTRTITLTSILLLGLVVLAAFFVSQFIARPLQSLTAVAEQITAGDLNVRSSITTQDEIGTLANTFNRMTRQLRESLQSLEQRVAERTADLEIARHQSEKRANELLAVGEISKIINGEQKLENLLSLITRLVSERFGFYHTGIFLIDETKQFAVLQAANSEGGRKMLDRAHKLQVGESGIVGYVAKLGIPRISLDVGHDAVFFNNPDLPTTRSEMALPLKLREETIGVLDVQSEKPGAFTDEDANTLSILADQIAIAIENARLFTRIQQSLNELQTLYRQNLQEGWMTFSREEAMVGYFQSLSGGKKITQPINTTEIQQAMNRGDVLVFHADGKTREPALVVPIKLRGQIIGVMHIKAPSKDRQWTANEISLTEAVSERLSLALENARLIQESQRQAIKEQTISEITGKIGSSINLENVLLTAVEELGRSIPGSEVIIKFQDENISEDRE